MRNSVNEIVSFLENDNFKTENQIQEQVFGFFRNDNWNSNKKYADMLRRGVAKGIIKRAKVDLGKTKFVYYV